MATTVLREDFLGRDLLNTGTTATDYVGRLTTSTADYTGRALRRTLRVNSTAYATVGTELAFADGKKFTVTIGGTTAASEPTAPAVGATVVDGTATLLRTK
jgi:hypothetical protein